MLARLFVDYFAFDSVIVRFVVVGAFIITLWCFLLIKFCTNRHNLVRKIRSGAFEFLFVGVGVFENFLGLFNSGLDSFFVVVRDFVSGDGTGRQKLSDPERA